MNRINRLFQDKKKNILNIYFTAGYPKVDSTEAIILSLAASGVDLIEIGMPYSDPLADGPTIQESGSRALQNGMTLPLLFEQVKKAREQTDVPLIAMGYFNQMMQYGDEKFIEKCAEVGIDGLILPDMPLYVYEEQYKALFDKYDLGISFLITPQTSEERIRQIDALSKGFIYMVSSSSITGAKKGISEAQLAYFNRINEMNLSNPRLIGFGISDNATFSTACQYANGAIIGSAFIRALADDKDLKNTIEDFVTMVRGTVLDKL